MKPNLTTITLLLFAVALSACAPSSSLAVQLTPSSTSVPPAASTPAPTSVPLTAVVLPTAGAANAGIITRDNNNQHITLHVGETFLLKLGQEYDWSPVIDNPDVISRVPNISVVVGAQGVYLAHKPGNATLTVTGDPACRQSKPACMAPSLIFTLTIEVLP